MKISKKPRRAIEKELISLLKIFYEKRISRIQNLELRDVLLRKNPYLLRVSGDITHQKLEIVPMK